MQKIFIINRKIAEFGVKDESLFPEAPEKCPHKGCHKPIKLKKHGFYGRNIISDEYTGLIYIRRYICPICGRTLSMLPMFCLPYYQYSLVAIVLILCRIFCDLKSLSGIIRENHNTYPALERRHLRLYKQRFEGNRSLIDYGINNVSPGGIQTRSRLEIHVWAKEILDEMVKTPPSIFNQKFHQETNKSFMSRIKMIA